MADDNTNKQTMWHRRFGPLGGAIAVFCLEVLQIVIISAAIVLPIRYFLVQPFNVRGASMEPNFSDNEYLIIDELSYRFREPRRGEVIVFRYPLDPSQYFIKRVLGLPGETIEVTDGKIILYNKEYPSGSTLHEPYLDALATQGKRKATLTSDEYMVFGDNRDHSLDSRSFGPIKKTDIVGRAWMRGLPLSRVSIFSAPDYHL